jgi:hypothetical protein
VQPLHYEVLLVLQVVGAVVEEPVQLVAHLGLVLLAADTGDGVAAVVLKLAGLLQETEEVVVELLLDL